ncbi:MAG: PfkB family carbohydrate kinase [Anaerolineales bacterium]|nr:PfkB family carbohydrate kinase [Anaerolineales bacterium]
MEFAGPVYYLALGHVAQDLTPDGLRLGGTVAYASLTAEAMGYTAGIVTACADTTDLGALARVAVHRLSSPASTTFENIYTAGGRIQYLRARAMPLRPEHLPLEWLRAPIVHLAPLAGELDTDFLSAFHGAFIGLTPQGWLRAWDDSGRVHPKAWDDALIYLEQATATTLSIEDVGGDWQLLERWAEIANVLAVTEGYHGCTVFVKNRGRRRFSVLPQTELDPTGAGDIFAAAFFIHLYETGDPWAAARVANHIASISVTRLGLAGTPTPEEVGVARLRADLVL